jgi:hypothetical protein
MKPSETSGKTQRRHVVISGTGRAGTSFLVQLLTRLGLDTGFSGEKMKLNENARAGLENDIRKDTAPYIVKSPYFCDHAEEVMQRKDIVLEHVIIPVRDIEAAAESRRFVVNSAVSKMSISGKLKALFKPPKVQGGFFNTKSARKQEKVLLLEFHKLMLALSSAHVPVTLLQYPRLVKDGPYLYEKLKPILGNITSEQFLTSFNQTVRPDWVHSFSKGDKSTTV